MSRNVTKEIKVWNGCPGLWNTAHTVSTEQTQHSDPSCPPLSTTHAPEEHWATFLFVYLLYNRRVFVWLWQQWLCNSSFQFVVQNLRIYLLYGVFVPIYLLFNEFVFVYFFGINCTFYLLFKMYLYYLLSKMFVPVYLLSKIFMFACSLSKMCLLICHPKCDLLVYLLSTMFVYNCLFARQ